MGRNRSIPRRIAQLVSERNRARVEQAESARYYDRLRAEIVLQRGLI